MSSTSLWLRQNNQSLEDCFQGPWGVVVLQAWSKEQVCLLGVQLGAWSNQLLKILAKGWLRAKGWALWQAKDWCLLFLKGPASQWVFGCWTSGAT